ncbi:MAG: helix-turn-helix domain-containing protein, partial [Pseudomonadota bacterium]
MDIVTPLSALAHPDRLAIFRLLMRRYPDAVPAGDISSALGLRQNTASGYLKSLSSAGLITATRDGTSIRYAIAMDQARAVMDGLFADCCRSRPDLCPALDLARPSTPLNVLFLCTGNAARSIMAEALLNHMDQGRFQAFSAGTSPHAAPNPKALALLAAKGVPAQALHSKPAHHFATDTAPQLDLVLTMCDHAANEDCPVWPGAPLSAHWGVPDPAKDTM